MPSTLGWKALRVAIALAGVALITLGGYLLLPVNATTIGFGYLLLVLIIASVWGFLEAAMASVAATLTFNYFFLPPVGRFVIADPQNWVALFSFLATALIAGRLSTKAKLRAQEAMERQQDVERLYTFSRAILLIGSVDPFARQLVQKLADIFELSSVVLYERRGEEFYRAGPLDFDGLDDQLRDAALQGTSFSDAERGRVITAVRLGSQPIAGLALQGARMPDSVLQGIANLVAIGLERARAQDLAAQVEAARQGEKLRTTLLDAMAHELKTPLTSVIAATTALLANPDQPAEDRKELVRIADEEAARLRQLIEDSLETARLDTADIRLQAEPADVGQLVREVVSSMQHEIDGRPVQIVCDQNLSTISIDQRLVKLALRQILDNALKYSPPGKHVTMEVHNGEVQAEGRMVTVAVTDRGRGIPAEEQARIFDRLYRGTTASRQAPGTGIGLSIAQNIVRAHHGDLTVTSHPGETTFRMTLPVGRTGARR